MTESDEPKENLQPSRVLFYSVTGSGKSCAAHRYAQARAFPEFSVDDDIGWLPGWQPRPMDGQRAIAAGIAAQDRWVLDSAYSQWSDLILPRAQLIVALDYPAGRPCSGSCDARPAASLHGRRSATATRNPPASTSSRAIRSSSGTSVRSGASAAPTNGSAIIRTCRPCWFFATRNNWTNGLQHSKPTPTPSQPAPILLAADAGT